MVRRFLLVVLAGASPWPLSVGVAQTGLAPRVSASEYEHDDDPQRDAERGDISGFYGGDDQDNSNGDPLDDRYANTYETFEFTCPTPATKAGSST